MALLGVSKRAIMAQCPNGGCALGGLIFDGGIKSFFTPANCGNY
jgi:hypothetical protein